MMAVVVLLLFVFVNSVYLKFGNRDKPLLNCFRLFREVVFTQAQVSVLLPKKRTTVFVVSFREVIRPVVVFLKPLLVYSSRGIKCHMCFHLGDLYGARLV